MMTRICESTRPRPLSGCTREVRHGRLAVPFCICLLTLLVASGWFVRDVLSLPTRTPVLTLTETYGPEWDLNRWVAEDLRAIEALGRATFSIQSLPKIDRLSGGFWDEAEHTIQKALQSCSSDVPVIVYANAHGAVNDDGDACWIPPGASVTDASTWFPIQRLLERIAQAQPGDTKHPLVLILECGKLRSHWPAGITQNDFANRLDQLVEQYQQRYTGSRIEIFSSTGPGQRSLASGRGEGNLFTRAIAEGLAGAADGYVDVPDGLVDTDELDRFVRQRVADALPPAAIQTPMVTESGAAKPIPLARVMRTNPVHALSPTPPPSSAETSRLRSALDAVAEIGKQNPIAVDPHAWAQVQRTSHGLVQSVFGGTAVRDASERWYSRLSRQSQSLRQKIAARSRESSMLADMKSDRGARVIWSAIGKQPSRETATAVMRDVAGDEEMPVPMLYALLQASNVRFWESRDWIKRVAGSQTRWLETLSRVPEDIYPAVEGICAPVHRSRRNLADIVLSDQEAESIEQAISDFERTVAERCEQLRTLRDAWQIRDRTFVELPFLVQRIDEYSVMPAGIDELDTDGINDVMRLDSLLSHFMAKASTGERVSIDAIAVAAKKSDAFLSALGESRQHPLHQEKLEASEGGSCGEVCQLVAAEIPRTYQQAATVASQPGDAPESNDGGTLCEQSSKETYRSRSREYLSVLLGLDAEDVSAKQVRKSLRSKSGSESGGTLSSQTDWIEQWRRVVSIVVDDDFSAVVDLSRKAARQRQLASRADVVLDDFWYAPANEGSPYFVAAADAIIDLADALAPDNAAWRTRKRELQTKLASRRQAAKDGVLVNAKSQPSYRGDGAQLVAIRLSNARERSGLPPGTAGLILRGSGGAATAATRSVEIKGDGFEHSRIVLPLAGRQKGDSIAEVHFRGNTFQSDVTASDSAKGVAATGLKSPPGASITISDAMDARRAVCFILDCSASMNDPAEGEIARTESDSTSATKFDVARWALYEMLRRLVPQNAEVGLVLYGHRMAVGGEENRLLLQKRYFKRFPFPQSVQPYADVDVALPTGRFDTVQLELARQHFNATVPWGQTPLYLAISKAIDDVAGTTSSHAVPAASKNVVVISDGRNYQFNPTADAMIGLDAVVQKAIDHGVRLHVIGFGLPGGEAQAAAEEFEKLAKETGGESVADVKEAGELLRRLEQFASRDTCTLQLPGGESVSGKFGDTLAIDDVREINTPVVVTAGDTQSKIPVSPGDQLRLIANQTRQSIGAPAYLEHSPTFATLSTDSGNVVATRIGVHLPEVIDGNCRFRVSLQNSDQSVPERPRAMWLEVHATSGQQDGADTGNRKDAYRIGASRWLPGTSCPVAEFTCLDWPEDASGYRLQAWCASEPFKGHSIQWNQLTHESNDTADAESHKLPGFNGVKYRARREGREIRIELQYEKTDDPDSMLAVSLDDTDLETSEHWYDETGMTSFHRFTFAAKTTLDLRGSSIDPDDEATVIRIGTITEMKSNAVKTTVPIQAVMRPAIATVPATNHR